MSRSARRLVNLPGDVRYPGSLEPNQLSHLVRQRRLARLWTQAELAHACNLPRHAIRELEDGHWPSYTRLIAVANMLGIAIEEIYPMPQKPTQGQLIRVHRLRQGRTLLEVARAVGMQTSGQILRIEQDIVRSSMYLPQIYAYLGISPNHWDLATPEPPTPLAKLVDNGLRATGMSMSELGRRSGVGGEMIGIMRKGHIPHVSFIEKVGTVLDFSIEEALPVSDGDPPFQQLLAIIRRSGLTNKELAKYMGVDIHLVGDMMRNSNITPLTVDKLEGILPIPDQLAAALLNIRSKRITDVRKKQPNTVERTRIIPGNIIGQLTMEKARTRQWSKIELAQRLGISEGHLRRIVNGRTVPGKRLLWRIAQLLELSPTEIALVEAERLRMKGDTQA